MGKITPFLMFNKGVKEAFELYSSVFKNVKVHSLNEIGNGSYTGEIEIEGQRIIAYDGGDHFAFSEGFSLMVLCEDQSEVDEYWLKLTTNGGEESMCGWLKDKFGLSWQIVPKRFNELLSDPDPAKVQRVVQAMLQMGKLDVAKLEQAANSK